MGGSLNRLIIRLSNSGKTFKERLGWWYHHQTLWRTLIGLVGKMVIELTIGILIATIFLSIVYYSPLNVGVPEPANNPIFLRAVGGLGATATAVWNCYSTSRP